MSMDERRAAIDVLRALEQLEAYHLQLADVASPDDRFNAVTKALQPLFQRCEAQARRIAEMEQQAKEPQ